MLIKSRVPDTFIHKAIYRFPHHAQTSVSFCRAACRGRRKPQLCHNPITLTNCHRCVRGKIESCTPPSVHLLLYAEERVLNKMAAVFTAPLWALVCIFQRHLFGEAASLKMHTFYVVFHVDAVLMTEEAGRWVYLSISGEFSEDYF